MSKIRAIVSNARLTLFITILMMVIIFLLQNTNTIQMNFLIFEAVIPTIVLILVTMLVGFFGGYLFAVWFRHPQNTLSGTDLIS